MAFHDLFYEIIASKCVLTQSALVDNLRKKCPLITLPLYINHGILYPILLQHTLHYDSGTVS